MSGVSSDGDVPGQGFGKVAEHSEIGLWLVGADADVAVGVVDVVTGAGLGPEGFGGRLLVGGDEEVIDGHVATI